MYALLLHTNMMNVANSGLLSLDSTAHETLMLSLADMNELGAIEFLKLTLFFSRWLARVKTTDAQHAEQCEEKRHAHQV